MSSDREISKEVTKLLLDTPGLRLLKTPPTIRHDGKDMPNGRVRPYSIFILTSAILLQMMSAQMIEPELTKTFGVLSLTCFLWGAVNLLSEDSGFPSVGSALAHLLKLRR